MKRTLAIMIGLSCCAGSAYADSWRAAPSSPQQRLAFAETQSTGPGYLTEPRSATPLTPHQSALNPRSGKSLQELAYSISYVGTIILTADQVVRSVDSVLDNLELTREDGSQLGLTMRPASKGFSVMLRMSRPLEF